MFSRTKGIATLALALTLPMAACDDGTDTEFGSLTLLLTDAPGDVAHAWVTIDSIYLQPSENENGRERVGLMGGELTVDLMTLSDDIEEMVGDVQVPTGFYEQLRVVVSDACIAVESETEGMYDVYTTDPAFDVCAQAATGVHPDSVAYTGVLNDASTDKTGIKVKIGGEEGLEVTGGQKILLLDFDVSESFGHDTGAGMWVLHPVIKGSEIGLTSSVTVSVTAADGLEMPVVNDDTLTLADLVANLSTEEADVALTDADGDGTFTATFSYLVPDGLVTPTVIIQGEGLEVHTDPVAATVTLVSGQDTPVSFVVTSVTVVGGAL